MNRAMVGSTEQRKVSESRCATIGPMRDVVRITVAQRATGKTAAAIAVFECAPDRCWYRSRAVPHCDRVALRIVHHDDLTAIAGEPSRRFRGDARAIEH